MDDSPAQSGRGCSTCSRPRPFASSAEEKVTSRQNNCGCGQWVIGASPDQAMRTVFRLILSAILARTLGKSLARAISGRRSATMDSAKPSSRASYSYLFQPRIVIQCPVAVFALYVLKLCLAAGCPKMVPCCSPPLCLMSCCHLLYSLQYQDTLPL